jgi:hypothetical protein
MIDQGHCNEAITGNLSAPGQGHTAQRELWTGANGALLISPGYLYIPLHRTARRNGPEIQRPSCGHNSMNGYNLVKIIHADL